MASGFSHAIVAVALGKTYTGSKMSWRFWGLAIASAVLPDADIITFGLGINYEAMLGHRGFTHSLAFALVWGFMVAWSEFKQIARFSREWWGLVLFFFVVTASHGVLDALTNGGLGVGFFVPFDSTRYFFPWHEIEVSPLTVRQFFSEWGGEVVRSELKYIWLPCFVLCFAAWAARRLFSGKSVQKTVTNVVDSNGST